MKTKLLIIKQIILGIALLCLLMDKAPAQDRKIAETSMIAIKNGDEIHLEADIEFSADITRANADLAASNITILTKPSNTSLKIKVAEFIGGSFREAKIELDSAVFPPEGDKEFTVCFKQLRFKNPENNASPLTEKNVCATGPIEDSVLMKARLEKLFNEMNAVPKSTSEKNIFASGFITQGANAASQGGGVLNLNSDDLGVPGLTAFTHLKKTTATNADPKHFDVGLNYRSTLLFHRKDLAEIRDLQTAGKDEEEQKKLNEEAQKKLETMRNALWSSATFDFATKFEAQALSFDVTNFIGDGTVQLKSRILPLRRYKENEYNKNRAGYFKFFIIPGGLEIGQVLQKEEQMAAMMGTGQTTAKDKIDWVARYKFGGGLSLFYSNPKSRWLFKRVELDTEFVGRQLFRQEIKFDEKTMMNIKTTDGFKPWFETGLRAYVADTPTGRFGIGLT